MTFDFTPEQQALVTRAREAAQHIGDSVAHAIDTLGSIPDDVSKSLKAQQLKQVFAAGAMSAVIVLEELAAVSAGLAAHIGFESATGSPDRNTAIPTALAGLRGSEKPLAAVEISDDAVRIKGRLAAAAVALGIGRAAVAHAVASMKTKNVKPGPDVTVPHWALADGATGVAAARLLTYGAAQSVDRGENAGSIAARALEFAANAAQQAIEAAIRNEGAAGYTKGGLLERLSRDAQTLQVILR
jgi:hypothetical protein